MIRISKPPQAPAILSTQGIAKAAQHCADYTANPGHYQTRQGKFEFDTSLYADPSVKQALEAAQHKKCCYCEIFVGSEGEVEHFRPKSASQQAKGTSFIRPGYYWLAYDWDNLFLSCHSCNALHKRDLFPLQDATTRARNHTQSCTSESPLFVHPTNNDPQQSISFRDEVPYPLDDKGRRTITSLKLQSERLNETCRTKLRELQALRQIISTEHQMPKDAATVQLVANAKRLLADCTNDEAAFAAMARANGF